MKNWALYRTALHLLPVRGRVRESTLPGNTAAAAERILRKYRCAGASLCVFGESGITGALSFGDARRGVPARMDTVYRAASVSKFVTALGAMKMKENGLNLDADVNGLLPFSLRHPDAPDTPITLRMLLTHTAGLRDGKAYTAGIVRGAPLSEILQGDSFAPHLPGQGWEYSNLGGGIAGAVMEAAAGKDFESLMQDTVFGPLGADATFYPQKVRGFLADARRILPPSRKPGYDAAARQARPLPPPGTDAERHYNLAHGSLCLPAESLAKIGIAGMAPGFLTEESLREMRTSVSPFTGRADNLWQGIGTFILRDAHLCPRPLYGHQGMAYGAVHGLFFDPEAKRGYALLTGGAGEARRGVLADLNAEMIRLFLGE